MRGRENPEDCAIRETLEETGLTVKKLERVGVLYFYKNGQREVPDWTVYVFLTQDFEGTPKDGREGVLKWFGVDSLPYRRCGKTTGFGADEHSIVESSRDRSTSRATSRN